VAKWASQNFTISVQHTVVFHWVEKCQISNLESKFVWETLPVSTLMIIIVKRSTFHCIPTGFVSPLVSKSVSELVSSCPSEKVQKVKVKKKL
jgi:hypothetical protein